MNNAYWHLLLNHLPIIFPVIGLLIILGGFIFKSEIVKRTSYTIFILGAIFTIPAFATGEGAEEAVEQLQGIDQKFIKIHEEVAETFAILTYILGSVSILGLWASFKKKSVSNMISIVTILFCLVVLFSAKQVGTTGGEIRHTEIRSDVVPSLTSEKNNDD